MQFQTIFVNFRISQRKHVPRPPKKASMFGTRFCPQFSRTVLWLEGTVHAPTTLILFVAIFLADIEYLKQLFPPSTEEEFFIFLKNIDISKVTLVAIPEGSVVFPRVPLIRIEGPLPGMC